VLLAEEEPDTISVITLFLSEIKEVQLSVAFSAEEALLKISETHASLVLFANGLQGMNSIEAIRQIHRSFQNAYVVVSLTDHDPQAVSAFLAEGANDCIVKDDRFVPNLVQAVKKALIRISERDAFPLSSMPRADQFSVDENLPDIIFYLSASGKILYTNRAVVELLGYTQKEIVHRSFDDLIFNPEHRTGFREFVMTVKGSHPNFRRIVTLKKQTGEAHDFEINFGLKEGELIYGVARPVEPQDPQKTPVALPTRQADVSQEIPIRIGPYQVLTLLGAGAMGRVYKGFDEQLERHVAIKIVGKRLAAAKDYLERFHREAKLLASITHPNIALIYYFGTLEGVPYFCMEYMPGGSLENLLREKKVVEPERALSYTMQVAIGLNKALDKGVVHLDVKPSNLMLAENDRIKIVDFGLARTTHQLQNIPSHIIGTPLYVAPEQIRGGLVDFRCDIYSLGITFFQMLYGFVPHAAANVQEVFRKRLKEGLPAQDQLDQSVPKHLYEIIHRMTNSDPSERYGTYSDLIADFEYVRRGKTPEHVPVDLSPPAGSAVYLRGLLYDQPFAEVLGHIASKKLSGKLTLSWFDLHKNVHFRDGDIVAVMSNQEGESFVDLLLKQNQLAGEQARKIGTSSDLFLHYSSAMSELNPETKEKVSGEVMNLSWHILQGLFSWVVGEFLFEEGSFPGQGSSRIKTSEVLLSGVRGWMDFPTIHRRLFGGRCRILLNPDFQKLLPVLSVSAADAFILFRFDREILFRELMDLSGISEDEFFRLIFLFHAFGIVSLEEAKELRPPAQRLRKTPAADKVEVTQKIELPPMPPPKPMVKEEPQSQPAPQQELDAVVQRPVPGDPTRDLGMFYYQCAINSYASKNYWASVEYCRKALEHRQEARIYRLMGNALATHDAFRHEAMEAYKRAMEIEPSNSIIERDIADLYFLTQSYALARLRYQNVVRKNPNDHHSQNRLKEIAKFKK
jgi:PAS domain S-box-containing protein